MLTNQELQSKANSKELQLGEYFWGKVTRCNDGYVGVVLLDGKLVNNSKCYPAGNELNCYCPSNSLVVGDFALFQIVNEWATRGTFDCRAMHIVISASMSTVKAKVMNVRKNASDLKLLSGNVTAVLLRSDYALDASGMVVKPVAGEALEDLIVDKVDTDKRVVYVSLRANVRRLAAIQDAFNTRIPVIILDTDYVQFPAGRKLRSQVRHA